ncbi:MAG: SDR family oxidoreductase [Hyphomicrobiaceae bacterium]|nr:SDR family oxidoreductase [Hyphomicrobiaceae bacterium]
MSEKTILITGCSTGIGEAAARILKARGWRVFATARTEADLQRLSAAGLEAIHLDYAVPASIADCAEIVLERTGGKLFALFNNGAYGQPGAVEDLRVDVLRAQFEANFFGWHDLTTRLIPAMRAQGAGRIVQCSSVLGIVAMKYRGAYTATKFALEALTDTLRLELADSGIKVVSIQPGPIATNFVPSSMKMFHAHIDMATSAHRAVYERRLARMARGGASTFKLGPEAVVDKLIKAIESPNPAPYYGVTWATTIMAVARRLLPNRLRVEFLRRVSDSEA